MGPGPMAAVLWEGNLDTDALGRGHVTMTQRFIRMTSSRRTLGEAREGPSLGASGNHPAGLQTERTGVWATWSAVPWRSGPRTRAHSPAGCVFTFVPGGCFLSCDRGHPSSEAHLPVAPRGRPGPKSRSVALSGPLQAWLLRGRGEASAPGVLAWVHLEGRRPFARGPAPRGDCGSLLHVRRLGFYRKFPWAHTLPSFLPPCGSGTTR